MSEQDRPQLPTRSVLGGLPQTLWSTEDSARFEAALEVLAQLAAALTAQITAEQNVAEPDQDRISALRAKRASLVVTRRCARPTRPRSIGFCATSARKRQRRCAVERR
jgi:hypothetical protein